MKKIFLLICSIVISGCAGTWDYTPRQYKTNEPATSSIQILKFSDARNEATNDTFKLGKFILHWVPFVLWSNVTDVYTPEGNLIKMSNMTEELAEATGAELTSSGLFENVFVMSEVKNSYADYTLKGTIIETHSSKTVSAYGLSFIGNIISLFGVPSGKVKNSITIKYTLTDKSGNKVFEKTYTENSSRPIFIYTELGKGIFKIQSRVYQNINKKLIKDLINIIK